jgi:hypothetical protein
MGYLKGSNVKTGRAYGAIASKSKVSDSVIEPFKGFLSGLGVSRARVFGIVNS